MLKKCLLAACLMLPLTWATPAWAISIKFDPSATAGSAGDLTITDLDLSQGNFLARGANGLSPTGTKTTGLFQANLGSAKNGPNIQFSNGTDSHFFTVVAGISEVITSSNSGVLTFGFDPTGTTNFFKIYENTGVASDLSGICFTCGNLVLSGVIANTANFFSLFGANIAAGSQDLDQFQGDSYSGQQTISGGGSFRADILITSVDNALVFPDLVAGTSLFIGTSELVLPFVSVDPSACFSANGTAQATAACNTAGLQLGVGSIGGAVNGLATNTMLQADANLSFTNAAVPEPATLALLGFGLLGCAHGIRRRIQQQAKS